MPTIGWRKGVLLQRIHFLPPRRGNRREFSCRHTPQQNGVAERKNGHLLEVAHAMLHEKHMSDFYWAEAASTAVYLMNQCNTNRVHELTEQEIFVGRKPILLHLKVFRSIAYVHILNEKRQNLDPKLEKCILLGYSSEQKGYSRQQAKNSDTHLK